jgi:hypothetical protein
MVKVKFDRRKKFRVFTKYTKNWKKVCDNPRTWKLQFDTDKIWHPWEKKKNGFERGQYVIFSWNSFEVLCQIDWGHYFWETMTSDMNRLFPMVSYSDKHEYVGLKPVFGDWNCGDYSASFVGGLFHFPFDNIRSVTPEEEFYPEYLQYINKP